MDLWPEVAMEVLFLFGILVVIGAPVAVVVLGLLLVEAGRRIRVLTDRIYTLETRRAVTSWTDALRSLLFGGHTLVRIGVLILFFGFSFFLSYVVEQGWVAIELRLAVATCAGLALLAVGWRLRDVRRATPLRCRAVAQASSISPPSRRSTTTR